MSVNAENVLSEIPQQPRIGYKSPPLETRFKPGNNANPGGNYKHTPKVGHAYARLGRMKTADLRAFECENAIEDGVKAAILRAVDASTWKAAHAALKEIADRLDGKPYQHKVIETVSTQRLEISIVVQLRALARVDGRELSHDDALLELANTREKLEKAQELGYLEAIEAEYGMVEG